MMIELNDETDLFKYEPDEYHRFKDTRYGAEVVNYRYGYKKIVIISYDADGYKRNTYGSIYTNGESAYLLISRVRIPVKLFNSLFGKYGLTLKSGKIHKGDLERDMVRDMAIKLK